MKTTKKLEFAFYLVASIACIVAAVQVHDGILKPQNWHVYALLSLVFLGSLEELVS